MNDFTLPTVLRPPWETSEARTVSYAIFLAQLSTFYMFSTVQSDVPLILEFLTQIGSKLFVIRLFDVSIDT